MSNGIRAAIRSRAKELGRRCEDGGSMWDTIRGSTARLRKLCHHVDRRVSRVRLSQQLAEITEDVFDQTEGGGSYQKVVTNHGRPPRIFVCGPVPQLAQKPKRVHYTFAELRGSRDFHMTLRRQH